MSRSPRSGGLDWFRLPAALLVVANHTSPLLAFSPEADHVLTQILARVAVPFFLTVSGYFLLPKAEREGRRAVCPFLRRTLLLYLCATLFYLPLQLYKGHRPGLLGALRGFARLTGLTTLLMDNDFLHFLAVACLSLAAGALFCRFLRPRPSPAPARCWAEIDLSALRHNLGALRARIPPECALMAVVKADGYGHGAVQIARFCAGEGVGAFAVATVNEGAALRRAGIKGDILVLGRTFPPEFSEAHRRNLILTVADPVHAEELAAFGKSLRLHVAVDTGMHRLGFPSSEVDAVAAVYRAPRLRAEGLFTHLCAADSDTPSDRAFTHLSLIHI